MSVSAVSFEGVSVTRRRRTLVQDASFAVSEGSVHALLGHNGAGKTTLLRAMSGVISIAGGRVSTTRDPVVLFADTRMPRESTAAQLLEYRRRLRGRSMAHVSAVVERVGIHGYLHRRSANLSTGMAQRVSLALALVDDAATIVLDEPTTGLDPQGVARLLELVVDLRAEGRTIMICSHDLSQLELVCDEVTCMRAGRVTVTGTVAAIGSRVPGSGQILRTADDERALDLLGVAGIPATSVARGVRVGPSPSLARVMRALGDLDVLETTVERGLFARMYDQYAGAPTSSRRDRRGAGA